MPGFVQRVFVQNIGIKVVSLLLAVGLWFAVARSPVAEVEMKVPIEFQNLPDSLEIDSASYTEAQIRVRGPERVIRNCRLPMCAPKLTWPAFSLESGLSI